MVVLLTAQSIYMQGKTDHVDILNKFQLCFSFLLSRTDPHVHIHAVYSYSVKTSADNEFQMVNTRAAT